MIENRNLIFIFFCGFISICGITLPGLSGSFLLILLGNYELLLVDSVNNLYNFIISLISNESTVTIDYELINILLIFFLGSVLGLIILSNFLSFISKKYPIHLNHLIIGFVSGTLPVVWPWNKIDTEISQTNLLNFETIFAFLIILLSVILLFFSLSILQPWIDYNYGILVNVEMLSLRDMYVFMTFIFASILVSLLPAIRAYWFSINDGMTIKI